ncbi:efflux RND transporter periplasmic adaptor subunit [Aliikangiella sp. G2MR2-5]|uniref:efflux RND transporter periplasmic adaptor subunit n=1 Tax=Aliikangiella sp. G2MR2-5 TaxID=2788943 RepID=UPI0018A944D8|nr:HlyD family efflux transporter periplasmic adaptor subunit [Aliikangiella sp. G2MR2-5]
MNKQSEFGMKQQRGKSIKLLLKLTLVVAFVGALIFAFMPEPIKVDIISVKQKELLVTIEGEGKTRIHDIYQVSTPIEGRVTRIEAEPGDRVLAGKTVLANMSPANPRFLDKRSETQAKADVEGAKAALALANARVKQAKAQLDYDEADFKRTQELFNKGSVSKANLERAELRLKTLRAELETAESNQQVMQSRLEAAQARLLQPDEAPNSATPSVSTCQICIYSPVDGTVLKVLHQNESVVPVGTPLVEIGNIQDLEVVIELLSTNAVLVSPGDQALIKRWGGKEDILAEVKLVEPAGFTKVSALGVEEQRVNVVLRFIDPVEKWRSLGHAFRVEAAIIIDRTGKTLSIPLSALFRFNENWSVYRVVDGKAFITSVKLGKRNERYAEIIEGLELNDQVINHPGSHVADEVSVVAR